MSRLRGRTALITGAGRGIGAETARLFCEQGARVLLVDRDAAPLEEAAARIRREVAGAQVHTHVADIAKVGDCEAAVRRAVEAFGGLDTVVNNAAIRIPTAVADAQPADWQKIVEVNFFGTVNVTRFALGALRDAGKASIVNVSSCYAETGRSNMGLYDATKAALLSLTRTLAFEEADRGIRVNAVCPGSTLTDYHAQRGRKSDEVRTDSLLKRWAAPAEIAYPILWLASDEASFVTGAALMVDGGLSIM
jgi:2-hydroxycyclohexanecarboxyl-CoA dehydrogenase